MDQQRTPTRVAIWPKRLASGLCALIVVGCVAFAMGQRECESLAKGAWDPSTGADLAVTVRGRELVPVPPAGGALELPAEDMLQIGEADGVALWAQRGTAGGGGAGG
jgi:hypothetical protein